MRILLVNQNWFAEELNARGHQVLSAGFAGDHFDLHYHFGSSFSELLRSLPQDFVPECLVYHDNSGPISLCGLHEAPFPLVYYSVDAHHHAHWQKCFAACFDLILVAQKGYLDQFQGLSGKVKWFPLWAPVFIEPAPKKIYDVAFRGTLDPHLHPKRAAFFSELAKEVPINLDHGPYVEIFSQAKIVVNHAVKDDLNFRVFEVLMSGALLLTPADSVGLTELFVPGEDLLIYEPNNAKDAAEKIRYYLAHEEERALIAERGRSKLLAQHTAMVRALQLEEEILTLKRTPRNFKHFGAAVALLSSSRLSSKISDTVGDKLLQVSAHEFLESLCQQEKPDNEFLCAVLYALFRLRSRGFDSQSAELLNKLHQVFPHEPVLLVLYVEYLLRSGREEEADEMAQKVSQTPEAFLEGCNRATIVLGQEIIKAVEGEADKAV